MTTTLNHFRTMFVAVAFTFVAGAVLFAGAVGPAVVA